LTSEETSIFKNDPGKGQKDKGDKCK
jgi:hypothetical protein